MRLGWPAEKGHLHPLPYSFICGSTFAGGYLAAQVSTISRAFV